MIKNNRAKHSNSKFNENETLINYNNSNQEAFNFKSIAKYDSIFKYSSPKTLYKTDSTLVIGETKPLDGVEKIIYHSIVFTFYALLILLMPLSLIFCLKKVKNNEKFVVYRLGRTIKPAYEPGYCILFPFIDSFKRISVTQKEFSMPNLQIINYENCIIETSTQIRYLINDVIKMQNNVADLNTSLRPLARSLLMQYVSKKTTSKIEQELYYIKNEIKELMNDQVKKWGLEVISVEITIVNIVQDESQKGSEDPALKTITTLFKSLLSPNNDSSSNPGVKNIAPSIISMFQPMQPVQEDTKTTDTSSVDDRISLQALIKIVEPLINENSVKQIQNIYEFYIVNGNDSSENEIFHVNLKHGNGFIGFGCYQNQNDVDCSIKVNANDLNDLLNERLSPLNAYMSGKIEINGNLQDVLKLKNLISSSISSS